MVRVAPVRMQVGPKVLWFDPADVEIHTGDNVIVSTERGTEFGTATSEVLEVSDELVANLKSPLKPVLRVASDDDKQKAQDLAQQGDDALVVFKELAAQTNEDMHPVSVEFLFDGDKAIFYFESDDRVDFRELVRKLAAHFHVRVDMRQIGVRDGARMIGGLGHCGQELCCRRLGGEFSPVSIRMAKEQNLSLNPQKISGVCGRLMCCLRYEYEAYKDLNLRAPKMNAQIEIPDGMAKVSEINVPQELISLSLEDGKTIKVPLSEMQTTPGAKRPNKISAEVFERYSNVNSIDFIESGAALSVANFTAEEKLATPNERRVSPKEEKTGPSRRRRRRLHEGAKKNSEGQAKAESAQKTPEDDSQKKQTNSSTKHSGQKQNNRRSSSRKRRVKDHSTASAASSGKKAEVKAERAKRPGQRSSGLRNTQNSGSTSSTRQHSSESQGTPIMHRRSRRRTHTAGGENHEN